MKHRKRDAVEIIYYAGTDRIQRSIPRSIADTKTIYLDMDIVVTAADSADPGHVAHDASITYHDPRGQFKNETKIGGAAAGVGRGRRVASFI